MYGNHYGGTHGHSAGNFSTSHMYDDEDPIGIVKSSGKKKSIFLDTKPTLDKRPSYAFTNNQVAHGTTELNAAPAASFSETLDEVCQL